MNKSVSKFLISVITTFIAAIFAFISIFLNLLLAISGGWLIGHILEMTIGTYLVIGLHQIFPSTHFEASTIPVVLVIYTIVISMKNIHISFKNNERDNDSRK